MANRKEKSDKAMFQDPFADLEGMGDPGQGEAVEEVVAKTAAKPRTRKKTTTEAKAGPAAKMKAAAKAEVKPRAKKRTTTKAKAKPEAEKKEVAKAEVKPRAKKRTTTKAKAKPEAEKKEVAEAKPKPRARKRTTTKAKAKPEAEIEPMAEIKVQPEVVEDVAVEAKVQPVAVEDVVDEVKATPTIEPVRESIKAVTEPEEGVSLLEELIAAIDDEVEEAFGPGAMADLVPIRQVGEAGEEQHVIFTLAGTEYAAHIDNVTEIGDPLDVTPVPNVPDWVLGVANLRGDIISMVDMRAFLSMEQTTYGQDKRMVVALAREEEITTGLIVDRVSGIRYLDVGRIGEPTAPIEDQVAPYLRGVYEHDGRLLVVLDFDRLLLSPEMRQF